jgi:hypothetical protein
VDGVGVLDEEESRREEADEVVNGVIAVELLELAGSTLACGMETDETDETYGKHQYL